MAIKFSCLSCGKNFAVKDELAGKRGKCASCGNPIKVPEPTTFVSNLPVADRSVPPARKTDDEIVVVATSPKRAKIAWSDPLVLGGCFAIAVLAVFGIYLLREKNSRTYRETIAIMKVDADNARSGDPVIAYEKYDQLLAYATSDPGDPGSRLKLELAKKARDGLAGIVRAKQEERKQIEREEKIAREALEKEKADDARMASLKADIAGGVWIQRKIGTSDILRGVEISIVPSKLPRRQLGKVIDVLSQDATVSATFLTKLSEADDQDTIESSTIWAAMHGAMGLKTAMSSPERYENLVKDFVTPGLMKQNQIAGGVTGIDGKYVIASVPGGRYNIYARYATEFAYIEWMQPVVVDREGQIPVDLYNDNSVFIANKVGD